jgi:proteasome alpha subunit
MPYTAYDWQQTLAEKADYAEGRLRRGSPVVALSLPEGILLLSLRRSQAKLYEVYDRLALGALGTPSDLEVVRQLAVDFSHAEGFQRSPEDVSIQRVVGFAISPLFKRAFSDPLRMPLVLRAVFAQLGETPEDDLFFVLGYDGEFARRSGRVGIAGSERAEARMREALQDAEPPDLEAGLHLALEAWAVGHWQPETEADNASETDPLPSVA